MRATHLLPILLFVFAKSNTIAQQPNCHSFCITNIEPDPNDPDMLLVTILFSSDSAIFINYPHITAIIDQSGDTIATGTLHFFGHFSNSSQDYPVDFLLDSLPHDLMATIIFRYDDDTCNLPYPCLQSGIQDLPDIPGLTIYPNPFKADATIRADVSLENVSVGIFNSYGQYVGELGDLWDSRFVLPRGNLPGGVYFLQFTRQDEVIAVRKVVIMD